MPVFIKNIMAVFGAHSALIARNKKLPANEKISFGFRQPAQKFVQSRQSPRGALRGEKAAKKRAGSAGGANRRGAAPHRVFAEPCRKGEILPLCRAHGRSEAFKSPSGSRGYARLFGRRVPAQSVAECTEYRKRVGRGATAPQKKIFFIKKPRQNNFAGKPKNLTVNRKTFRFNSRA